jgi:hypothetical protein
MAACAKWFCFQCEPKSVVHAITAYFPGMAARWSHGVSLRTDLNECRFGPGTNHRLPPCRSAASPVRCGNRDDGFARHPAGGLYTGPSSSTFPMHRPRQRLYTLLRPLRWRGSHAPAGDRAGNDQRLLAGGLDGGNEVRIIPRINLAFPRNILRVRRTLVDFWNQRAVRPLRYPSRRDHRNLAKGGDLRRR